MKVPLFYGRMIPYGRGTVAQAYIFTVSPGTHTFTLKAYKSGSGTATVEFQTISTWFAFAQQYCLIILSF